MSLKRFFRSLPRTPSLLAGVVVIAENAALDAGDRTVLVLGTELRLVLIVEISNYFHLDCRQATYQCAWPSDKEKTGRITCLALLFPRAPGPRLRLGHAPLGPAIPLVSCALGVKIFARPHRLMRGLGKRLHLGKALGVFCRDIRRFADVATQLVQLPRPIGLCLDRFPKSPTHRRLTPKFPVQHLVFFLLRLAKQGRGAARTCNTS